MEIVGSKTLKDLQIVQEETQITLSSLHSQNSPSSSLFISFYSFHLFLFFLLPFQTFSFLISPPFQLLQCFFSHHLFPFFVSFVASIFFRFSLSFFSSCAFFFVGNHLPCINLYLMQTTEVLHISESPTAITRGHKAHENPPQYPKPPI